MKRKKIKSSWTEYFNFSTRERRGALLLASVLAIQLLILFWINNFPSKVISPDPEIVNLLIKANMQSTLKKASTTFSEKKKFEETEAIKKLSLFPFNPNQMKEESWTKLGLSLNQIKVIMNYLEKGGSFHVKNDFKKMYCIPSEQYEILQPYILLPDSFEKKYGSKFSTIKKEFKNEVIDLSYADSAVLVSIRGIGPTLAGRIIKYREMLGGFTNLNQLKEVWGIRDSLFDSISQRLVLRDTIPFRFIDLNNDSFVVFSSHPYIKYKIASMICNYRKQHGAFHSGNELRQLPLITDEMFRKLAPYLLKE